MKHSMHLRNHNMVSNVLNNGFIFPSSEKLFCQLFGSVNQKDLNMLKKTQDTRGLAIVKPRLFFPLVRH